MFGRLLVGGWIVLILCTLLLLLFPKLLLPVLQPVVLLGLSIALIVTSAAYALISIYRTRIKHENRT